MDEVGDVYGPFTVGFTGTREGMTPQQKAQFLNIIRPIVQLHGVIEFHHGDCVGADADAHDIVAGLASVIVIHPPKDTELQAHKKGDVSREPLTHFARNRAIVEETRILFATPRTMRIEPTGGTSYTIKYARKMGKTVVIIWPDGSFDWEVAPSNPL